MLGFKTSLLITLLLVGISSGNSALGQCILANPSFELGGTSGRIFAGWNQFSSVGFTTVAPHGSRAAKLTGPNAGNWAVSGFWQRLDTAPGDRWSASVLVWHSASNPLTASSQAIVNIEWRDASENLISYESYTAADASTPPDQIRAFSVESGPAPPGTAATHILLGVLQGPTDPTPVVYYDLVEFENLDPPTMDEIQWNDFPTSRTIDFGGQSWRVKGPGYYGPGPSNFCSTESCVWVDAEDRLHMTIRNTGGAWRSTEVALENPLGYGDYVFTTLGRLDTLDLNVVLGLFTWQYGPCYEYEYPSWNPYNEIDVEISRWGNPANDVSQFVTQPWDYPGNIERFPTTFSDGELTSFAFRWHPDRVEYRTWHGGPQDETPGNMIHTWTYTGPHIPRPEQPRIHINLWQIEGIPPATDQEVTLEDFTFIPSGGVVDIAEDFPPPGLTSQLTLASPNPFRGHTKIRYNLAQEGPAEILVYDVSGRLVRTLASGSQSAGSHEVLWDGRDNSGNRVASGVYLYQFRSGDYVDTRRVVFLN